MNRPVRSAFLGGLLGSAAWPLLRWLLRRGPGFLFVTAILLMVAWQAAPVAVRALVILTALTLVGLWLWSRLPRRRPDASRWLPRQTGDLWWVYVLWEWRDSEDRVLSKFDAARRDAVRHLVYIGKSGDIEARFRQHMSDKPWWHDNLACEAHWFPTEDDALRYEEFRIRQAATSPWVNDRPRENRQHNPSYDPARSERMRARA